MSDLRELLEKARRANGKTTIPPSIAEVIAEEFGGQIVYMPITEPEGSRVVTHRRIVDKEGCFTIEGQLYACNEYIPPWTPIYIRYDARARQQAPLETPVEYAREESILASLAPPRNRTRTVRRPRIRARRGSQQTSPKRSYASPGARKAPVAWKTSRIVYIGDAILEAARRAKRR